MASSNKKWEVGKVCVFQNIFEFIDGLCIFNSGEFENNYNIILLSWNSRRKMKIFVKFHSWNIQWKSMIENLQPSCLVKKVPFPYILITCLIWVAICCLKYFMLQLVQKFYILPGQQQILLILCQLSMFCWYGWKKQGNECICTISLLKKIFGKDFKLFHNSADTAGEFINLLLNLLLLCGTNLHWYKCAYIVM